MMTEDGDDLDALARRGGPAFYAAMNRRIDALIAGSPRVQLSAFSPAVADKVSGNAHRWLVFVEMILQREHLNRESIADRERATAIATREHPEWRPTAFDVDATIRHFMRSGNAGSSDGSVHDVAYKGTAMDYDYDTMLVEVARQNNLHLNVPTERARAAMLVADAAPELVRAALAPVAQERRLTLSERMARGAERGANPAGLGIPIAEAQRQWDALVARERLELGVGRAGPRDAATAAKLTERLTYLSRMFPYVSAHQEARVMECTP